MGPDLRSFVRPSELLSKVHKNVSLAQPKLSEGSIPEIGNITTHVEPPSRIVEKSSKPPSRIVEKSSKPPSRIAARIGEEPTKQPTQTSKPMSEKPLYRIGDGLKFYPGAPGCDYYPDSIVCAYQRRTKQKNSIPALLRVLEARNQSEVPPPEVAVVHARLGDGLCGEVDWRCRRTSRGPSDCWNDIHDCFSLLEPPYPWFAYPKEYYTTVVQGLNVSRLVVMTSLHHRDPGVTQNGTTADERYLSHLTAFLKSRGFDVELRLNNAPDDDFAYASAARTFVKGGGGFSRLIS